MQVRVAGWSTPRSIYVDDSKNVVFEVAETDGCSICQSRIDHVKRVLAAQNIAAEFRRGQSRYGDCLYVALPPAPEGADLKSYVGQTLRLNIA